MKGLEIPSWGNQTDDGAVSQKRKTENGQILRAR
jgi:hypothetical protein